MRGKKGDGVGVPLEECFYLSDDVKGVGGEGSARWAVSDGDEVVLRRGRRPRLPEAAAVLVPRVGESFRWRELVEACEGDAGRCANCQAYFPGPAYGVGAAR